VDAVHDATVLASKAARSVDAADGRRLVDFGLRRAHGAEAGLVAARAAWLAGFDATSNVLAGRRYGIPVAGTMAHSYVQSFPSEEAAFEAYVDSYPDGSTLLIDTYDAVEGARRAARIAHALSARGGRLGAVRVDSGDLAVLSRAVRDVLDGVGLADVTIFASGNLDERAIAALLAAGAPIDGFGVGSRLAVSADAPYLDAVYKLVAVGGRPVRKLSPGKATLPGAKQVWRSTGGDVIALADEPGPDGATPLLEPAMTAGVRVRGASLGAARERASAERGALAPARRRLDASPHPVEASDALARLADELSRQTVEIEPPS
jgi:nicotinate phosphoribosyltransferase